MLRSFLFVGSEIIFKTFFFCVCVYLSVQAQPDLGPMDGTSVSWYEWKVYALNNESTDISFEGENSTFGYTN